NDLLAMVVMRGLRRAGFSIPDDLSVLGFDGIDIGELLAPPIASINRRHAWRPMSRFGVATLASGGAAIER
ncbi:substrate-binding domain-containing protein, partial [Burkholderia multivorans]|uniref:substrate-binding domain-containing protein n=1 Tax=Burkholderia multivorans TaxID=87883 RepID=UPI000DB04B36